MRAACVLVLAVAFAGCDQPVPLPVAERPPSLESEDIAVLGALFDDLLWQRRPPEARLLVVDLTMAMCRRDPLRLGPSPGRCLLPSQSALAAEVLPGGMSSVVSVNFPLWNATALPITGSLGPGVVFVSPTLADSVVPGELLRAYPRGSDIVTLSAPAYPAPRIAVVLFSTAHGDGAARLERQPNGHWRVADHRLHGVE